MKCIAYVSEAPLTKNGVRLPIGLSGIVKASNRNHKSEMTGFLCYRQGYYFQIVEGPDKAVSQLALKISADSRHENFRVLINKRISQRSFSDWKINVFNFIDQAPLFKQFIEDYKPEVVGLNEQQKNCLQYFYDLSSMLDPTHINTNSSRSYEGKSLKLIAWPDFNQISQSQMTMNLCVKLTKHAYTFDQLVANNEFGTREQVTATIEKFDALGILKVTKLESPIESEPLEDQDIQIKKPSRFYGAIKKFLGMR